jgi:ATP-dependent DNA helicase UvrD/PcrA
LLFLLYLLLVFNKLIDTCSRLYSGIFEKIFCMQHKNDHTQILLNPEQQAAVTPRDGVFLVCAGAGSGKTRVITMRMLHLMAQGAPPSTIVALTFTNKAANEMKERMISASDISYGTPLVGTFHSFCLRLLKSNASQLNRDDFSILDDDDQEKLLRTLINRHSLQKKTTPKSLSSLLSRLKNESTTGMVDFSSVNDPLLQQLCILYEREKAMAHCLDFDDLLLETLRIFRTNTAFKTTFQSRVRHLLVDEYQDTNHVQHALLKAITLHDDTFALDSLCVVGDEDQAIYSWRGATVTNMVNFAKDFPTTKRFTIEQNYRSVQPILDVANTVISYNTQRTPKKLWSERSATDRVRLLSCASGYQESEIVALCTKIYQTKLAHHSLAVLYRSHYQSRALEEALIRHSLPYTIIGGIRFYERQEIKDMLAYLRLIANPFDRISFMRVINVPARGLGDKFQEQFVDEWNEHPLCTFKDIAELITSSLSPTKQAALQTFLDCFSSLQTTDDAHGALTHIINKTQYMAYLATAFEDEEATTKKENIKELLHAIQSMEGRTHQSVTNFLDEVALLQDSITQQDAQHGSPGIRLMTLHAAKGLEFDTVILTGLEEGILPSIHNLYDPQALEEERRLLYVGITRAKERLLITHARYRYTFGAMTDQLASRFMKELMTNLVHHQDGSAFGTSQITSYLNDWLSETQPRISSASAHKARPIPEVPKVSDGWYLAQKVHHEVFGKGTIKHIDTKDAGKTVHLTIAFGTTTKKVAASFVKPIS